MELADVTDSKSVELITRVGSSPTTGTTESPKAPINQVFRAFLFPVVSVQSCGQNRYRGGYPYPPRTPRAKNGVRGRETPSPSPEPRRRRLLSCVQAAPPAGCEPRTSPAGTVRGVVPLHSSPERHRDRVPDRPLHAAETDHNRREIPPIPPRCCHTFVLLHTRLNSYHEL